MMNGILADSLGIMGPSASSLAPAVDFWFDFVLWVSIFFFVLIIGVMGYFIVKYRKRPGVRAVVTPTHSTSLEMLWTVIPSVLVVFMFWGGFKTFMDARVMPADADQVTVHASQWNWEFIYPNGLRYNELHVVKDRPLVLTMYSDDVIHSFYVPAMRVKQDVLAGRFTKMWFTPVKANTPQLPFYHVFCAEYCGTSHSKMDSKCVVHATQAEFDKWLEEADPLKRLSKEQLEEYKQDPQKFISAHSEIKFLEPPVAMGKKMYDQLGCKQCHSVDGKPGTGPTWKGIWGKTHEFNDTPARTVNEEYIRDSILNPGKDIVKNFTRGAMPSFQGRINDGQILVLIKYIESLGDAKAADAK